MSIKHNIALFLSREYNKDIKAIAIWKEVFKTKYRAQMTAIAFLIKK